MSSLTREFVKIRFQKRTYFGLSRSVLGAVHRQHRHPLLAWSFRRTGRQPRCPPTSSSTRSRATGCTSLWAHCSPCLCSCSPCWRLWPAARPSRAKRRAALCAPSSCSRCGAVLCLRPNGPRPTCTSPSAWWSCCAGSFIAGGAIFGFKPMLLLSGQTVGVGHGIGLLVSAYVFVLVAMATVVSLAVPVFDAYQLGPHCRGRSHGPSDNHADPRRSERVRLLEALSLHHHFAAWANLFRDPIDLGSHPRRPHQLRSVDRRHHRARLAALPAQRHPVVEGPAAPATLGPHTGGRSSPGAARLR